MRCQQICTPGIGDSLSPLTADAFRSLSHSCVVLALMLRVVVLTWSLGSVWAPECLGLVLYELQLYTFSFLSTLTRLLGPAAERHPHAAPITLHRNHCAWLRLNMIVRIHFNLMMETRFYRPLCAFSRTVVHLQIPLCWRHICWPHSLVFTLKLSVSCSSSFCHLSDTLIRF